MPLVTHFWEISFQIKELKERRLKERKCIHADHIDLKILGCHPF
jgi:hypothetical protein